MSTTNLRDFHFIVISQVKLRGKFYQIDLKVLVGSLLQKVCVKLLKILTHNLENSS